MSGLWGTFLTHQGRVVQKLTHYFPAYERHSSRYVNRPVVFWEIGVAEGGSLQLWKRYFGPYAQIVGLDILDKSTFEEEQIPSESATSLIPLFFKTSWTNSAHPT